MSKIIIKNRVKNPDKIWTFLDGSKRSAVILETTFIGIGTYEPGWRWSKHVGKITGKKSERHIGYILSGHMMNSSKNGKNKKIGPGDAFEVGPDHDGWVYGNIPCVALDFGILRNNNSDLAS